MPKIKNILIFIAIAASLVLVYIFFIRKPPAETGALVSAPASSALPASTAAAPDSAVAQEFLTLLLSVKNIKLNDAVLSDPAFASLDGSHSITLVPDGTEGRPNPFAPLGSDSLSEPEVLEEASVIVPSPAETTTTNTTTTTTTTTPRTTTPPVTAPKP